MQLCGAQQVGARALSLAPKSYIRGEKDRQSPLYRHQDSLPSLPVPKLDDTMAKYLKSVRPLASDEEYENTKVCRLILFGERLH